MPKKSVFMFSGQGSHYYGMGRELFAGHAVFRRAIRSLDELFADAGLPGVLDELYRTDRGRADVFDALRFTHPAILMVEFALVETLRSEGIEPDCVLGASLGEFAAAATAGVVGVEQVARSIADQVSLVEGHCPPGGMLAVLGSPDLYERHALASRGLELAAVNTDRHFVVSGTHAALDSVERELSAASVSCLRLGVGFAFHSTMMDSAAPGYRESLSVLEFQRPTVPFVSCDTAGFIDTFEVEHFWKMVRRPIRFRDAVRFLEEQNDDLTYIDLGPSGTLANFARQNLGSESASSAVALIDPFARPGRGLAEALGSRKRSSKPAVGHGQENSMKALIFPGQGSQQRGMGKDLFPKFRDHVAEADEILGYSIARLCTEDPDSRLDQTRYTQPALYVVNALEYLNRATSSEAGTAAGASYLAGHSLGEYNALFAAGAFSFGTGLRLVKRRAELMAEAGNGAMAAVIGLSEKAVRGVLATRNLGEIDLANHNAPDQYIVSGTKAAIQGAQQAFTEAGARAFIPLKVSGAFHSRYMEPARSAFERYLSDFRFEPLRVPVLSNVTGQPHIDAELPRSLAEQLVRPVLWEPSVRYLLAQGVSEFEDAGPGAVLTGLVNKIRSDSRPATNVRSVPQARAKTEPAVRSRAVSDAEKLGSAEFREAHGTRYAYVCGAMYRGIASEDMVIRAGRAGILAFFGTGGLSRDRIEQAISKIRSELPEDRPFGMNLVHNPASPAEEDALVAQFLDHGIHSVEASAFMKVTGALVRYRLTGVRKGDSGEIEIPNRVLAKVSRPEVAEAFLSPAPQRLVERLREQGLITAEEATLAELIPMADDLCVEADSGGHTDGGQLSVMLPSMLRLRDRMHSEQGYETPVRIGAAGGIGTPESVAAAFLYGADFVLTGSINLCTAEAGTSPVVKDMLQRIDIQDTDYAPAGDMFELGAQVQVLKRGVFFPARARKLYELYRRFESLDEIDQDTRAMIENRYFQRTFDEVWRETRKYFEGRDPREVEKAEANPKHKMALVFRWYFGFSQRAAMEGAEDRKVDFQIHCGPSLGAFNQWARSTPWEGWRDRHVDEIGVRLMGEAVTFLRHRTAQLVPMGTAR